MTQACYAPSSKQLTFDDFGGRIFRNSVGKITGITTRVNKSPAKKPRDHCTGGGPQPIQHCCGTCGHHKSRKTFHETCPRLFELLFKGGTKSAKVLMEETQRENCEGWISKAERIPNVTWCSTIRNCPSLDWEGGICTKTGKKLTDQTYCPTQHQIGENPERKTPKIGVDLQYCETLCANCENHLALFSETCPRYNDLVDQGGKYSETELMEEVQRDGCLHKIPKCQPKKKRASRKSKKAAAEPAGKPVISSNEECVGCRFDNLGTNRVSGPGCLHPDFGKSDFCYRPARGEGGCYEAKKECEA